MTRSINTYIHLSPSKMSGSLELDLDSMKKVQIRSFCWSEYKKIRTRKTPYLETFHAVRGSE